MTHNRIIELPSLGRPMQLGMLYDCRNDTLIPGLTLWDPDVLKGDRDVRAKHETHVDMFSSDSVDIKSTALGIEASLKGSILAGLVEVKGSGKYMNDRKRSRRQSRLVLQYKTLTRFEQLTMKHLGRDNVQHANVFEQGTATHVVTGILYGAQAFFVFDRHVHQDEQMEKIEGQMKAMIDKISKLFVEGEAELKMKDEEQSDADIMECKLYCDFRLEKNPTNYHEAANIYNTLSSLLGIDGEHAVPITVWLYPLTKLDPYAAKLVREVSVGLISRTQDFLEELDQSYVRASDLKENDLCKSFPQFAEKIEKYMKHISNFKLSLQQKLARILPRIRRGGDEEQTLVDFLEECEQSPFCFEQLDIWLKSKEKEMNVVKAYMKGFSSLPIIRARENLDEMTLNPDIQNLVCYSFPLVGQTDEYLQNMSTYIRTTASGKGALTNGWFNDASLSKKMRIKAKEFKDFASANSESEDTFFAVMAIDDGESESLEGGCIFLYEAGILQTKDFQPPGPPGVPSIIYKHHDAIALQWNPPKVGVSEIETYLVKYGESGTDMTEWKETRTSNTASKMKIQNLEPNTAYEFIVASVSPIGVSQSSAKTNACKTLPTSPPRNLQKYQVSKSGITVRWKKPLIMAQNVSIGKYLLKYISVDETNEDRPQEMQIDEPNCVCDVAGLKPSTTYRFWVSALCNDAGSSAFSEPVDVSTSSDNLAIQKLLRNPEVINDGNPIIYRVPLTEEKVHPENKYRMYSFGEDQNITRKHRVIMVVGATGSGKSTLINAMFNAIIKVDWKDNYRFKITTDQAEDQSRPHARSQTQTLICYTIYPSTELQLGYNLTIIDTPGFGDTRGLEQDKNIIDQIREFFTNSAEHHIDHIDAIGFVAQASLARLTPTQRYVFDSVLSIFGKDIKDNIIMLVTFADRQKPALTDAIKEAEILYSEKMCKFNNSALFATYSSSGDEGAKADSFNALFWNMGMQSMQEFFFSLDQLEPKSISLTSEVLRERKQLEVVINGLNRQTQIGCSKMEELSEEHKILEQHKAEAEKHKDFTYTVSAVQNKKENLTWRTANNCNACKFTCHHPCMSFDLNLYLCEAFTWGGDCKVCPGKCPTSKHNVQRFTHASHIVKQKRTYKELEQRYKVAKGKTMTYEEIIKVHRQELIEVQKNVEWLINESRCCLKRLDEIALRPDPLNMVDYIDILTRSEEREAKQGWRVRVNALESIRRNADLVKAVQTDRSSIFQLDLPDMLENSSGDLYNKQEKSKREQKHWTGRFLKWILR